MMYHEKVCLGIVSATLHRKDTASFQILRKRHAQVRIVELSKVRGLGRVGGTDLARLDGKLGLSQSSSLDQDLHYTVLARRWGIEAQVFAPSRPGSVRCGV